MWYFNYIIMERFKICEILVVDSCYSSGAMLNGIFKKKIEKQFSKQWMSQSVKRMPMRCIYNAFYEAV